jgi:hypothetical protein
MVKLNFVKIKIRESEHGHFKRMKYLGFQASKFMTLCQFACASVSISTVTMLRSSQNKVLLYITSVSRYVYVVLLLRYDISLFTSHLKIHI